MLETTTTKMENLAKEAGKLSDVSHAQDLIHEAFPSRAHGTAQAAIWRAYRKLKLKTERRARAIWNGEAKRIDAHEMQALEAAALEEARRAYIESKNRIAALESRMAEANAYFHRPSRSEFGSEI